MKNIRYIAFLTLSFLLCASGYAQREKIDSLRNILPTIQDSSRIDCLNALGGEYIWIQMDTAEGYALQALEQATKLNYIHGMAEALTLKAAIVFTRYNNFPEAENITREAIRLYAKTPNKAKLNRAYYELGRALYAESYFRESISNFAKGYVLSKIAGDSVYMFYTVTHSAYVYLESGNYLQAFEKGLEMHQLASKSNSSEWKYWEWDLFSSLYSSIEDFNTALLYTRQLLQINQSNAFDYIGIAELFSRNGQFDSAKHYYNLIKDTTSNRRVEHFYLVSKGEYYFLQGEYNRALPNFLRGLLYHRQTHDRNQVMRTLVNLAKTYDSAHNYATSFRYAHEALAIAQQTGARQYLRDSYHILYSIYDHWHQKDSALFYHTKYVAAKDSITSSQVAAKLIAYDFDQKIEILNKEKQIQQAHLRKEAFVKKVLLSGITLLLVLGMIVIKNNALKRKNEKQRLEHALEVQKLESEKTRAELQQQATELEMQALRAQMNPHFIFNCLNSINHFILSNETENASDYLTKFSRLIRTVLCLSQKNLVSLEEELDYLNLYIQLEQLRFQNHFQYTIHKDEAIDPEYIRIPPMLIQPFVENAIWHGLMHKKGMGKLRLELSQDSGNLCCTITDNGIGRSEAAILKSKSAAHKKSLGMQITASRLQLLNEGRPEDLFYKVVDLKDTRGQSAGTRVIITMPVTIFETHIPIIK
jgi:tetratricopeptide (TPR) repeat protein